MAEEPAHSLSKSATMLSAPRSSSKMALVSSPVPNSVWRFWRGIVQ